MNRYTQHAHYSSKKTEDHAATYWKQRKEAKEFVKKCHEQRNKIRGKRVLEVVN